MVKPKSRLDKDRIDEYCEQADINCEQAGSRLARFGISSEGDL